MKHYVGNITPSQDTIFVFGSNPEGIHGAGAAAVAVRYFGAIYGIGEIPILRFTTRKSYLSTNNSRN